MTEEVKQLDEADKIMEIPISYVEKGKKEGRKEGKIEGKREVALEMLREGASIDFIKKTTKLDEEEIEELKNQL